VNLRPALPPVLAIVVGLGLAGLAVLALGVSPFQFYGELFSGTLGSGFGFGQVLFRSTPLLFTGLAVGVAFQAKLFNIGAEGQMLLGALAMAVTGTQVGALPAPLAWTVVLFAGAAAGGVWGAIPGILKARTGAHEVIVTILLNFIAFAIVNYLLVQWLALPETVRTASIADTARVPRLSDTLPWLKGSPASWIWVFGVFFATGLHYWQKRSSLGFSFRILGDGEGVARYAGLPVGSLTARAMTLSGAIAGLAGAGFVLGYKHYFEDGLSGGAGFLGIAVALLARNRPLWILASAFFFGLLSYGGFVVNRIVPRELLDVLQAVILLLFILFDRRFADRGTA